MTLDMFEQEGVNAGQSEIYEQDVHILRGFALSYVDDIMRALTYQIKPQSPLRHMTTPGGNKMSVATANCGKRGWVTSRSGYQYTDVDPLTRQHWPQMPATFMTLAQAAADKAGFANFIPDSCLINEYQTGSKMSLHQDKNEADFSAPIVSVSLGIPATFLLGGFERQDKAARIALHHGDVMVWGRSDRLRFHGILPIKSAFHSVTKDCRINITFRKAL
ncbi:MAG: alkylated DNA repair protein (DNA oxidative demethylase) [Methylophagaceae bacterium]|jgi:alkylated DNA repair protein (DNA oxidative demethylase)